MLIVKLSSLGDVVHAMPVVHDLLAARPGTSVDWVVEEAFAPLVRRVAGVAEVIECSLRRWRRAWWTATARTEWDAFRARLERERYDAVLDLQGLTKSAVVARLARGTRYGLANRTDGSSYELPVRWLVDRAIRIEPHIHVVDRSRELAARALGYVLHGAPVFGLSGRPDGAAARGGVVLVHGTSREDKLWPEDHWIALGRRLADAGHALALPHAGAAERARAERIAAAIGPAATVWPGLALDAVVDWMAAASGVIGVDSGLSHVAVALDLPHVQIYNVPTQWRTGPQAAHGQRRQVSVEHAPWPDVERVWAAWCGVTGGAAGDARRS